MVEEKLIKKTKDGFKKDRQRTNSTPLAVFAPCSLMSRKASPGNWGGWCRTYGAGHFPIGKRLFASIVSCQLNIILWFFYFYLMF